MKSISMIFKTSRPALLISGELMLTGCDKPKKESWSGGDLRGVNHKKQQIPSFSVNGSVRVNIGSYGEGGGACCISLPDK